MGVRARVDLSKLPGYKPGGEHPKCGQCGRELRPHGAYEYDTGKRIILLKAIVETPTHVAYGYDSHGAFCTLACGYLYGLRAYRAAGK